MFGLSATHMFILLIIVLIIFGPGKLPSIGKQLGAAINEFKTSVKPKEEIEKTTAESSSTDPSTKE